VDDCLKSVPTTAGAIKLTKELPALFSHGGFRLTKWVSNERDVMSQIPTSEQVSSTADLHLEKLPTERALGVEWNVQRDSFRFCNGTARAESRIGMLSCVASVCDPLGLAAPMILQA